MIPGDAFTDPLIKRGEYLERERNTRALTSAESEELLSIKLVAHARLQHTIQFPLANTAQEEDAQFLSEQQQRACDEVAEVMRRFVAKYGERIVDAAFAIAVSKR